jgi:serine/threonine-protein kinase HipA
LRGKEIFTFEYKKDWLQSGNSQFLDPDLQLFTGVQYPRDEKRNFGIFLDSSPDRWGRVLMQRREAIMAKRERRLQKTLFETDYLLGVYDQYRMGAIRFREKMEGPFLNDNHELAAPPWTKLRELEYASLQIENAADEDSPDYLKWLNMLMAPGSSLGGARPKASILDAGKNLWIAKFPSIKDEKDIGAWEMVANELAQKSGVKTSQGAVRKFSNYYHTFLTMRFDRQNGGRTHFASAMTLLGYKDGTDFNEGASYLEIAEFIMRFGAEAESDLEELWRRIVFNICISNTDDHLRNHGFLLTEKGWKLSPAFDINPVENGTGLHLNIDESDNSLDLDLAMSTSKYYRLPEKRALEIIHQVKESVSSWSKHANKYNIPRIEQEIMSKAFKY